MNTMLIHQLRNVLLAMVSCLCLASCLHEASEEAMPLPDGKYPLVFTVSVDGMMTRADGKGAWAEGDTIGIRFVNEDQSGCYILNADGTLKETVDPLYWRNTSPAAVSAWFPYTAVADVDISDQSEGFSDFDYLTAMSEDQTYKNPVSLHFRHQMAKVTYTLHGDGVTDDLVDKAVVTLFGDTTASFEEGMLAPAEQTDGEITPYSTSVRTGSALLIPQDMTGNPLIKVTVDDNTFIYSPDEMSGCLMAGCHNTYAITLKTNGIEVTAVSGSEWAEGDTETVDTKDVRVIYAATDIKKGDYIYKDGTVSDGGLRKIYVSGELVCEPTRPLPLNNPDNPVVGIVFWTPSETDTTGRITPATLTDDKIMSADYPYCTHGLAVSVHYLKQSGQEDPYKMMWQNINVSAAKDYRISEWQELHFSHPRKADFASVSSGIGPTDNINRIYGYQNTIVIRAYNQYCRNNGKANQVMIPCEILDEYAKTNPAPLGSTGWFIPSAKELYILSYNDVDDVWDIYWTYNTAELVQSALLAAGGDPLPHPDLNTIYWTSTESDEYEDNYNDAFSVQMVPTIAKGREKKSYVGARAVCAF